MENIQKENALAIEELSKGNEAIAQSMFQKNVQTTPCCLTLNNLGVFYCQYGKTLKNGRVQSAKKVGLNYLLKATSYETNWYNSINIATIFLELGDIPYAYRFLLSAYAFKQDNRVLYNIGVCLFRLGKFEEASSVFKVLSESCEIADILKNGGTHPLIILAYCQNKLNNKTKCIEYVRHYRELYNLEERLDIFHLRYLCGMYEEALSEIFELLKEWYPTQSILAMVIECLSHTPEYFSRVEAMIDPMHKKQWKILKGSPSLRSKMIDDYSYVPPTICLYQYINKIGDGSLPYRTT